MSARLIHIKQPVENLASQTQSEENGAACVQQAEKINRLIHPVYDHSSTTIFTMGSGTKEGESFNKECGALSSHSSSSSSS